MVWKTAVLCLVLSLAGACGKRGLPPSPDRWAPKLANASAVDRNHVDVIFSEKMDRIAATRTQNYVLVGEEGDSLAIYSASLLADGQTVRLTTDTQKLTGYSLSVSRVRDAAGNEVREGSVKTLRGSSERDLTRPQVRSLLPEDGSVGVASDSVISVLFSETMDTSSVSLRTGSIVVLPPPTDSTLAWNEEMSAFSLPVVVLASHKTSVLVTRGCTDYGGNRLLGSQRSTFTTEDSMPGGRISGAVEHSNGLDPLRCPVGLFDSLWTPLLLDHATDETGNFLFTHLADGLYWIAAAYDQDGDGQFDLTGVSTQLAISDESSVEGVKIALAWETTLPGRAATTLLDLHRMDFEGTESE